MTVFKRGDRVSYRAMATVLEIDPAQGQVGQLRRRVCLVVSRSICSSTQDACGPTFLPGGAYQCLASETAFLDRTERE